MNGELRHRLAPFSLVHFLLVFLKARYMILKPAPSIGNIGRFLVVLCSLIFCDSIVLVARIAFLISGANEDIGMILIEFLRPLLNIYA